MKRFLVLCLSVYTTSIFAQEKKDSTRIQLQPVDVKIYFAKQSTNALTASSHTVSQQNIQQQNTSSLVQSLNTVAGLRMEERSPGSYRIALRGSMIRSPFGIRNTKIYVDEFPLTDAGGNTYLNLIDPFSIDQINIIKGPDGSVFGANSGGVIRISPKGFENQEDRLDILLQGGSFGHAQQQLSWQHKASENYQFSFDQSFQRSDGFRDNSALNKKTFQTAHLWQYKPNNVLKFFALYSDLGYQTPGGLTLAQYNENPKASRPAGGPNPSAKDQKAAIYNKTVLGGIAHQTKLSNNLEHHIAISGSYTDFTNPFITNYEERFEQNLAGRTYFIYKDSNNDKPWSMQLGAESNWGWYKIHNYDNNKGEKGNTQAKDNLNNTNWTIFYKADVWLMSNWLLEGSIGLNKTSYSYDQDFPNQLVNGKIKLKNSWISRVASSYQITNNMTIRGAIASGYSPPTIAEIRSSDNTINRNLQAESGVNYEIGYRLTTNNRQFIADLTTYSYQIDNGIIRQLNDAGNEFYNNVGKLNQKGVEASLWSFFPIKNSFLNQVTYQTSGTYQNYKFKDYKIGTNDFTGNHVTSIPKWIWTNAVTLDLLSNISLNIYHNFTDKIPLDDANNTYAEKYHLLQAKFNYLHNWNSKYSTIFFFGVDNVLNEKYSLGNDINAFGGRFFNASPTRNFYVGIKFSKF